MPYIKMKTSGKNRKSGEYKERDILEVSPSLADLYILNGKGKKSSKEEFDNQKKGPSELEEIFNLTNEQVKEFDYKTLKRKPLEAFAVRVGIDIEVAEKTSKMKDLNSLISTKLSEEK
ncbi:MAG: hypothetical protein WA916_08950 [Arcobacter sp.]|uniref:hypothetical protein n=1 Tax=Arcobacter sp. TaxID=1872629 RepID=UPI003C738AAD